MLQHCQGYGDGRFRRSRRSSSILEIIEGALGVAEEVLVVVVVVVIVVAAAAATELVVWFRFFSEFIMKSI